MLPGHRPKGTTETLIRWIRWALDEGAMAVLISVDPGNLPSIKGIERAGCGLGIRIRNGNYSRITLRQNSGTAVEVLPPHKMRTLPGIASNDAGRRRARLYNLCPAWLRQDNLELCGVRH